MNNIGVALAGGNGNRRENDFYPTPWEATVALMKRVKLPGRIWEPACGDGAMSRVLEAAGHEVYSSDIVDRGYGDVRDFFDRSPPCSPHGQYQAVVTNPPFNLAERFIRTATDAAPVVAMLLKAQFWHAARRLKLFEDRPPSCVLPLTWRLDFTAGGAPTMDCMWCVWGVDERVYEPLPKPKPSDHPAFA